MADVRAGRAGTVPAHLRDAHYAGAKLLGHGQSYVYAHDEPHGVAAQQYLPDELGAPVLQADRPRLSSARSPNGSTASARSSMTRPDSRIRAVAG